MAEFVYTGNEVEVVLGGKPAALLQNVRIAEGFGHEPASGIGEIDPREHVPTAARYSATFNKLVMRIDDAVAAGIINENGEAAMRGRTFDIEVFKKNGGLIRKIIKCVNDTADLNVTAHRMLVMDAAFLGVTERGTFSAG